MTHLFTPHGHDSADRVDTVMESSREGMRALWISLGVLGVTAIVQAVVVVMSGSVALLSDTLHNVADALTAVPVGIAFWLGRRPATRRAGTPCRIAVVAGDQLDRDALAEVARARREPDG